MSSQVIASLLAVRANTRLVLATELVARNTECVALREQLAVLRNPAPAHMHTAPTPNAPKTIAPRAPRPLPAHFVAAREAAMRLGKCVRVETSA